jgi:hypothetical protein
MGDGEEEVAVEVEAGRLVLLLLLWGCDPSSMYWPTLWTGTKMDTALPPALKTAREDRRGRVPGTRYSTAAA